MLQYSSCELAASLTSWYSTAGELTGFVPVQPVNSPDTCVQLEYIFLKSCTAMTGGGAVVRGLCFSVGIKREGFSSGCSVWYRSMMVVNIHVEFFWLMKSQSKTSPRYRAISSSWGLGTHGMLRIV